MPIDPRLLALMRTRSCGDTPGVAKAKPKATAARAAASAGPSPSPVAASPAAASHVAASHVAASHVAASHVASPVAGGTPSPRASAPAAGDPTDLLPPISLESARPEARPSAAARAAASASPDVQRSASPNAAQSGKPGAASATPDTAASATPDTVSTDVPDAAASAAPVASPTASVHAALKVRPAVVARAALHRRILARAIAPRRASLRSALAADARRGLRKTFSALRALVTILARAVLATPHATTTTGGYGLLDPVVIAEAAPNAVDTPLPLTLGPVFFDVGDFQPALAAVSSGPAWPDGAFDASSNVDSRLVPRIVAAVSEEFMSDVPDVPASGAARDAMTTARETYPGVGPAARILSHGDAVARPKRVPSGTTISRAKPSAPSKSGARAAAVAKRTVGAIAGSGSRSGSVLGSASAADSNSSARPGSLSGSGSSGTARRAAARGGRVVRIAQAAPVASSSPGAVPAPSASPGVSASAGPGATSSSPAPASSPSPAPSSAPSASAAPTPANPPGQPNQNQSGAGGSPAGGDQVTPLGPLPAQSATLLPVPPVPAAGPQQIIPPTARPTGSPTVSPVPLPSAAATSNADQPVFLVRPSGTPSPLPLIGGPQQPGASPSPTESGATPKPTLQPYQIVTIADRIVGSTDQQKPSDLYGNVHLFYIEGQIVGDRAHFDGDHTITLRGHTYLVNRSADSILYADQIVFDLHTRRATLLNGRGESIEGVAQGKLHFAAEELTTRADGVAHGEHANFTTCENPHAGYHVEARTIDVTPGDKLVARKAVVFLGPLAIFYLPLLVIPLRGVDDPRRQASFLPLVGYDDTEGAWIKLRIGFAPSSTYYGYYRVEYFTKRGLGLGYDAYIGAKDAHRYTTIDAYTIDDHVQEARLTNVNIQDTENFSRTLRGQFGVNYEGDFGPNLSLPASLDITGSVIHQTGTLSTENLTFSRFLQGTLSDNLNLGFIDTINLNQYIQQQINLTYARFNSPISASDTFQIDLNTHAFTKAADYNFTYDKTDYSSDPFGYDRVPELQIVPHLTFGGFKYAPQLQFTLGEYAEPQNHFSTSRFQGQFNEAFYAKVFGNSDFTANYNLTQDYYGTGDEKAYDQQNASLSTPIGDHLVNSVTYNEQHPIGPSDVPFQLLDNLSPGAHSAQDVIRFYNKDVYSFSLSAGTQFDRMAQPVSYQLNYKPSARSYIVLGGYFTPGPGQGFGTTNVQAITPLGKDTTLEFTTNVDWMNHEQLEDKNIYLSQIVANCYQLQLSYNQDLKQFNFQVVILAFPSQGAGFGIGGSQSNSIIPQALNL